MTSNDGSAAEKNMRDWLWAAQFCCRYDASLCGCHIRCPVLFLCFCPKTTWGTHMSSENYLIIHLQIGICFPFVAMSLEKDSPSMPPTAPNSIARATFPKPCSEERWTLACWSMWVGGQERCDITRDHRLPLWILKVLGMIYQALKVSDSFCETCFSLLCSELHLLECLNVVHLHNKCTYIQRGDLISQLYWSGHNCFLDMMWRCLDDMPDYTKPLPSHGISWWISTYINIQ